MPTIDERTIAFCLEIADRLRAAAADEGEDLTPADRRELVEIALALERMAGQ